MDGCPTTGWCRVSLWMVKLPRTARLNARGTSDVCSEPELRRYIKYDVTRYSIDTSALQPWLQRKSRYSLLHQGLPDLGAASDTSSVTSDTSDTARVTACYSKRYSTSGCATRRGVGSLNGYESVVCDSKELCSLLLVYHTTILMGSRG